MLGGSFLSRLNTDLRETKHWSYGVQGFISRPQHQVPYLIYWPVQTDQTGPSIAALRGGRRQLHRRKGRHAGRARPSPSAARSADFPVSSRPPSAPHGRDGIATVLYHRPDNYYETLASRYRSLTAAQLDAAAKAAIDPDKLTWVVIGDAAKVKPQLEFARHSGGGREDALSAVASVA